MVEKVNDIMDELKSEDGVDIYGQHDFDDNEIVDNHVVDDNNAVGDGGDIQNDTLFNENENGNNSFEENIGNFIPEAKKIPEARMVYEDDPSYDDEED